MSTRRQAILEAVALLRAQNVPSPLYDARELLAFALRTDVMTMRMHSGEVLTPEQQQVFDSYIEQRCKRMPLQYITGRQAFMGLDISVRPGVLIPRQDTESVCEYAMGCADKLEIDQPHILDLCCGSGCIGVVMAVQLPKARVTCADIDPSCIEMAKANALKCGVSDLMRFAQGDLWEAVQGETFDLIVSNPPYIPRSQIPHLQKEVRDFEPELALNGGSDGFDFYHRIIEQAAQHLAPGGYLVLEAGDGQADLLCRMLRQAGFQNVENFPDLSGNLRGCAGQWKNTAE
ncbi:peptide chain release factor N(5)-glutamine methyltransferase [Christensenellaceae bacterium NSJ-44]|uniref:Release factor glutamine methyltransferase n=1 Tax=Luoshenia tenuis TaxID=2763654 RepID=A0A926CZS4_9FIRM|nr:peptide chain release factor N(5)-glutamine methyltransferase [Luoshenia tenuis]MBC8528732.1 peptide chain release factor N(5)-glutamine methyltransferase [Luoshenia tenuis]